MGIKISGLVVAHNEEKVLEDALKSLHFCDEIVVVLDKCTDGSKKIAEKYATNLIEGSWEIEGPRRNTGIDACTGDWIVELDADERIAPALAKEIQEFVKTAKRGWALLPVQNYIGKRYVQHGWAGSFGTTKARKLYAKGCKYWDDKRVHPPNRLQGERYEVGMNLPAGEGLIHLVDTDLNDMIDRLQRYTDAMAQDMRDAGEEAPHFMVTFRKGMTRFYKSYLVRKGYKEGPLGFWLALMAFCMPVLTHLKVRLES